MKRNKNIKGFTLLEVFLVSAMVAIISLAIYTTFANGIKIWQKAHSEMLEEDVCIFFERFTSDLRNSFKFKDMSLLGKEDMIEVPTLVRDASTGRKTIGKVVYSYDPGSWSVIREARDFSQIYSGGRGVVTEQLRNVKSLKFSYYFYNALEEEYVWHDEYLKEQPSLVVRLELEFYYKGRDIRFIKTVVIPVYG